MREYKEKECEYCKEIKPVAAKGLCRACYGRLQRNGKLEKVKVKNICEVEGCDKYVVTHGLCDKHRKRLARHGHMEPTRPNDWGDREKHPLYVIWSGHRRHKEKHSLCREWHGDFWKFVSGVGDRPSKGHDLMPICDESPISHENFHWVERVYSNLKTEDQKAYLRQWAREDRKRNPDKYKNKMLIKSYGITLDIYNEMLIDQGFSCAICEKEETAINPKTQKPRDLAVDHCHKTGRVRGLLCSTCNTALGSFDDDISLIQNAITYLKTR